MNGIKVLARLVLLLLATFFGLGAALGAFGRFNHKSQNAKNLLVLEDMKDRVNAVRDFERLNGRLPTTQEIAILSGALPVRYAPYRYSIVTRSISKDPDFPQNWPAAGGWVLTFWRGEWSEYYSSWDDRYTLSQKLTAWDSYGFSLTLAIGLFLLSRLSILQSPDRRARKMDTKEDSRASPDGV